MDMGNYNYLQRIGIGQEDNCKDDDTRERGDISPGYHSGGDISTSSSSDINSDDESERSEEDVHSTNSENSSGAIHDSGLCDKQVMGVGYSEPSDNSPRVRCHITSMRSRIESLGLSSRTVGLHCSRITGLITRLASARNMTLDDYVLTPKMLIDDMNKLYMDKKYKANSIKCIYASVRHYILARELDDTIRENVMNHYDSDMALYEKHGLVDVSTHKQGTVLPEDLREFVIKNYSPDKNFAYYVTGLIYSQYPLRDDLTNIRFINHHDYQADTIASIKDNYIYDDGTNMFIRLNKTKTIPKVYPPISLPLDKLIVDAIRNHPKMAERPLLRGRRSVILKSILKKMGTETPGGAVNYVRRSHAKHSMYNDLDTMLFVMGHSAKTHGKHYL